MRKDPINKWLSENTALYSPIETDRDAMINQVETKSEIEKNCKSDKCENCRKCLDDSAKYFWAMNDFRNGFCNAVQAKE